MITEYIHLVGLVASVSVGGLDVDVRILDIKKSYGNLRYLVEPIRGDKRVWVQTLNEIQHEHTYSPEMLYAKK